MEYVNIDPPCSEMQAEIYEFYRTFISIFGANMKNDKEI
jgi:hypothetical protein